MTILKIESKPDFKPVKPQHYEFKLNGKKRNTCQIWSIDNQTQNKVSNR